MVFFGFVYIPKQEINFWTQRASEIKREPQSLEMYSLWFSKELCGPPWAIRLLEMRFYIMVMDKYFL